MAAIDLRGAGTVCWPYTVATSATTWQEFQIPMRVKVTVTNESTANALYIAGSEAGDPSSSESPADGGAVGTHRFVVGAGATLEFYPQDMGQLGGVTSIFVAAATGTDGYSLWLENA